jgi:hypothetical protein
MTEPINRERDSPSTEDCKEPPSLTNPYKFVTDADGSLHLRRKIPPLVEEKS